jgi:ATP-dependent RNA helicase RhlE
MNSYPLGGAALPLPPSLPAPHLEREQLPPAALGGEAFAALGLAPPLVRAVAQESYLEPTPIQARAIPELLAGRDLLGCAQTGTGKTAAFLLPMLQHLSRRPSEGVASSRGRIRALVLTPTRELAAQIDERASAYGRYVGVKHTVIFGGVGQRPQERALARRPELVVATPGRLLDLMAQGLVRLDGVEIFVLDEADRMLDMGFIHDVRRIIAALPARRQTLLFSATLPDDIGALARNILRNPLRVSVTPAATTVEAIEQSIHFVARADKRELLDQVLRGAGVVRALVFTRTKRGANRVATQLGKSGIAAAAIHGNKSQGARERALEDFRQGRVPVLVATDIAARGIDVDGISHVVNYDLPNVPESYVHRIGRTGRAGAAGVAISFCDAEERAYLRDIERLIQRRIPVAGDHEPRPAAALEPRRAPVAVPAAGAGFAASPPRSGPAWGRPQRRRHFGGRRRRHARA